MSDETLDEAHLHPLAIPAGGDQILSRVNQRTNGGKGSNRAAGSARFPARGAAGMVARQNSTDGWLRALAAALCFSLAVVFLLGRDALVTQAGRTSGWWESQEISLQWAFLGLGGLVGIVGLLRLRTAKLTAICMIGMGI